MVGRKEKRNDWRGQVYKLLDRMMSDNLFDVNNYEAFWDRLPKVFYSDDENKKEGLETVLRKVSLLVCAHICLKDSIVSLPWLKPKNVKKLKQNITGVTAQVFMVKKPGVFENIGELSHSELGIDPASLPIGARKEVLVKSLTESDWLSCDYKRGIKSSKLCAEERWMAQYYEKLVDKAKGLGNSVGWLGAIRAAHIAVYTSSSLCGHCQRLFKDFYEYLREEKSIRLPIFFFARKATNINERQYGVWTIENGVYTSLPLSWSEEGKVSCVDSIKEAASAELIRIQKGTFAAPNQNEDKQNEWHALIENLNRDFLSELDIPNNTAPTNRKTPDNNVTPQEKNNRHNRKS